MAITDTIIDILRSLINGTSSVKVDGSGSTQPVSGSVSVSNLPVTQPVSGSVSVSNFPGTQAVTGTFFQATQPVSGSVSVSNLPSTQPVSGSVSVSNFPASQTVAGSVSVSNFPSSQAVTGTFFQGTQPVSGTVAVSNFPATQPVSGTFFQVTQPISASVLPLPSNAAIESGGHLASLDSKAPSLGAHAIANSTPVTIASDQVVPVSLSNTAGSVASGLLTSAGSVLSVSSFLEGNQISVQLQWAGSGTIMLEQSEDAIIWYPCLGRNSLIPLSTASSVWSGIIGQTDHIHVPQVGAYFRIRLSDLIYGTVTVYAYKRPLPTSSFIAQDVNIVGLAGIVVDGPKLGIVPPSAIPVIQVTGSTDDLLYSVLQELRAIKLATVSLATEGRRMAPSDFDMYGIDESDFDSSN